MGQVADRERLKRCYAAADLFVFPSLYDNAPLVVREAAAMQTPALLAEGSTAAGVVADGMNGFTCRADERSIADRLLALLARKDVLAAAGINARKTLARPWSDVADEVYDRYLHLIRRSNRNEGVA